jgi:hypothetical protein
MLRTLSRWSLASGVLAAFVAVAAMLLAGAPAVWAADATPYAWTGADSGASAPDWSNGDNWTADGSPATPIGTLAFPSIDELCPSATPYACLDSVDDLGPLTAQQITVDDSSSYLISAEDPATDTITLDPSSGYAVDAENSGLNMEGPAEIDVPLVLATDQKWRVYAGQYFTNEGLSVAQASGDHTLEVDLDQYGTFHTTDLDTGALTITGDGTGTFDVDGSDADLPAAGVDVENTAVFSDSAPGTISGPLTVQSPANGLTNFFMGGGTAPDATLAVTGQASFDPETYLRFDIDDNGTTPSTDYSQLTATGGVDFDSAKIYLDQGKNSQGDCVQLAVGDTYTLVSSRGGLSGALSYLDSINDGMSLAEGETSRPIAIGGWCGSEPQMFATLTYNENALTATIIGGNVPTFVAAPTISGTPAVGSPLQATTGSWDGDPTSYHYSWSSCALGGACGTAVGTDSSEYMPTTSDVGRSIEVCVSATNSYGTSDYAYCSNYTSKITTSTVTSTSPPTNLGALTILGVPVVGHGIGVSDGDWSGSPTFSYQWERCANTNALTCVDIPGATSQSYTPTSDDQGHYLGVTVTATNAIGSDTKYATPVGPVTAGLPASSIGPITTSRPRTVTPLGASQIRSTLEEIGHPSGKKATTALVKAGAYRTTFRAPASGTLSVVWTTTVTTGIGRHKKRTTVTIATGTVHPGGSGTVELTIHLTASGKALLKKNASGVGTTARETFDAPGPPPRVSVTKKFSL